MKLLICDDDISTIDVICRQLDLGALGIDEVLRAYNGEAAKELIREERPELILCDIGMPKVNGIEVLKYVYDNDIPTEFTFLTCFADFEYARDAVRYGAVNYLTKPVDFEELTEAVKKMVSAAREREGDEGRESSAEEDARANNILRQLLYGFYGSGEERIANLLEKNNITAFSASALYRLVLLTGDMTDASSDGWQREHLVYSFGHLAEEALTDHVGLLSTVVDLGDRYIRATTFVPAERFSDADCSQRAQHFVRLCSLNLSMAPVCLISDPVPLYKAADAYHPLLDNLRAISLQAGSVHFDRDIDKNAPEPVSSLLDEVVLLRFIKEKDRASFLDAVTTAVNKVVYSRGNTGGMMTLLHQDLMQLFFRCLKDNYVPIRVLFQNKRLRSLDENAQRSSTDLLSFAAVFFDYTLAELERVNGKTDMMSIVKAYIGEHYRENIDRNDVAAVAFITPNYLSKRFHTETGMSLREYINQLRIDEAKKLLLSTDATISEVASHVGYDNISYFSTVFRRLCGMSPIEWCGSRRGDAGK